MQGLQAVHQEFENDNYTPHASIGVLTQNIRILSSLEQIFGEFEVKEIQLMVWNWDGKKLNDGTICHRFSLTAK